MLQSVSPTEAPSYRLTKVMLPWGLPMRKQPPERGGGVSNQSWVGQNRAQEGWGKHAPRQVVMGSNLHHASHFSLPTTHSPLIHRWELGKMYRNLDFLHYHSQFYSKEMKYELIKFPGRKWHFLLKNPDMNIIILLLLIWCLAKPANIH